MLTRPRPAMHRTTYGDADRFVKQSWSEYEDRYFTGHGCKVDEDGYFLLLRRVDDVMNVADHHISTDSLADPTVVARRKDQYQEEA